MAILAGFQTAGFLRLVRRRGHADSDVGGLGVGIQKMSCFSSLTVRQLYFVTNLFESRG